MPWLVVAFSLTRRNCLVAAVVEKAHFEFHFSHAWRPDDQTSVVPMSTCKQTRKQCISLVNCFCQVNQFWPLASWYYWWHWIVDISPCWKIFPPNLSQRNEHIWYKTTSQPQQPPMQGSSVTSILGEILCWWGDFFPKGENFRGSVPPIIGYDALQKGKMPSKRA